jgi:RHS repeat-associated protein
VQDDSGSLRGDRERRRGACGRHYNYFRTYDPVTGRYLEADPIGQASGVHVYAYVASNPLALVDPDGLGPRGAAVGAAVGGVVGGVLGGLTGGTAGAAAGTLALPGGGTFAGGAAGGEAGAAAGFALGGVGGAALGSLLEDYVVAPAFQMAKGGRQSLEDEWSREAMLQPDPCAWLRDQYDQVKDSATRKKRSRRLRRCLDAGGALP